MTAVIRQLRWGCLRAIEPVQSELQTGELWVVLTRRAPLPDSVVEFVLLHRLLEMPSPLPLPPQRYRLTYSVDVPARAGHVTCTELPTVPPAMWFVTPSPRASSPATRRPPLAGRPSLLHDRRTHLAGMCTCVVIANTVQTADWAGLSCGGLVKSPVVPHCRRQE